MGAKQAAWAVLKPDVRTSAARVRWHLRHAEVGPGAIIRGRPYVTCRDLHIGHSLLVLSQDRRVRLSGDGRIDLGSGVFLNAGCMVIAQQHVEIGNDVALSLDALVVDSDFHGLEGGTTRTAPTRIGDGSWIGARAVVLAGVNIGKRCVVGAGAIVTKDVPDDTLVAGQPARAVRRLSYPEGVVRAWTD